jgi:ribosomal protein S12 methylthiotransferase
MIDDVSDEEKRDRLDRIMALQTTISAEISETHIGERLKVLVDRPSDEPEYDYMGRTRMDAPEIDGEVFISGEAKIGEFVEVEITDAFEYDLVGKAIPSSPLIAIAPPEKAAP